MQHLEIWGKIEGRRRRGKQRMRWVDSITDSMDMGLSKFQEMMKDKETWHSIVHGVAKSQTQLSNWTTTGRIQTVIFSVQLLSHVWRFASPWTDCHMPGFPVSTWSLLKPMSIELVMPTNHIVLCCHLLLLPSIFPSIRDQGLLKGVSSSHQVAKVLEFQFQHQSFQWIFRTDFL